MVCLPFKRLVLARSRSRSGVRCATERAARSSSAQAAAWLSAHPLLMIVCEGASSGPLPS
jgi:hypothetical protein